MPPRLDRATDALARWCIVALLLVSFACSKAEPRPTTELDVQANHNRQSIPKKTQSPVSRPESLVCAFALKEASFHACNPEPRFETMPDCLDYVLKREDGEQGCANGRYLLTVAGPQAHFDELMVQAEWAEKSELKLILVEVKGSMLNGFRKKPGVDLGRVSMIEGRVKWLDLGDGLLPSEINVTRVPMTDGGYD